MLRLEELLPDVEWQLWLISTLRQATAAVVDITDHNAFVMYELGLAHAHRLPTLLIVDSRNERVTPTVLGTPFLPYDVDDLGWFEKQLASAVSRLSTGSVFSPSYEQALSLATKFSATTGQAVDTVSRREFATRLDVATGRGDLPRRPVGVGDAGPTGAGAALHLLARVVKNADDVRLMRSLWDWSTRVDIQRA
ncbi:hypothetical protein GCM10010172_49610 [Paractinoplanes ferrugineus]|uniref:Uncharacterized protein n=2 Tax=Paractinoplanes ferrugineus TaxID=113564 RepID=A0A919J9J1_9ACTN|nr:hypothetical protein Afe05nite_76170 [Actinoplanes ferrugineus]